MLKNFIFNTNQSFWRISSFCIVVLLLHKERCCAIEITFITAVDYFYFDLDGTFGIGRITRWVEIKDQAEEMSNHIAALFSGIARF